MKKLLLIIISIMLVFSITGCTEGTNVDINSSDTSSESMNIELKPIFEKNEFPGTYTSEGISFGKSSWRNEWVIAADGTCTGYTFADVSDESKKGIWKQVSDMEYKFSGLDREHWNYWKVHDDYKFIYRSDHGGAAHKRNDIVRGEYFSDPWGFSSDGTYGHNDSKGTYEWVDDNIIKVSIRGNRDYSARATKYYCLDDDGYLISEVYARKIESTYGITKTMTVAINPYFKPFNFYDENGKLTGFDIELIELVADKLGLNVDYKEFDYKDLPSALTNNYAHIAIGGIENGYFADSNIEYSNAYVTYKNEKEIQCSFMLPKNSKITEHINEVLLEFEKSGEIQKLYDKYSINTIQKIDERNSTISSESDNLESSKNHNTDADKNSKPNNLSNNTNTKPSNNTNTSSKPATTHTHSYSKATCTKPATCSCGHTSEKPLGHLYKTVKEIVCVRCQKFSSKALNKLNDITWELPTIEGKAMRVKSATISNCKYSGGDKFTVFLNINVEFKVVFNGGLIEYYAYDHNGNQIYYGRTTKGGLEGEVFTVSTLLELPIDTDLAKIKIKT